MKAKPLNGTTLWFERLVPFFAKVLKFAVHVHSPLSLSPSIGVTFDTGGISIKPSAGMPLMKGDMGGAACVVATVMAIAQLDCPVSVVGLVPLCENMPSGNAVKPGDVVTSMNGKTISVSLFRNGYSYVLP